MNVPPPHATSARYCASGPLAMAMPPGSSTVPSGLTLAAITSPPVPGWWSSQTTRNIEPLQATLGRPCRKGAAAMGKPTGSRTLPLGPTIAPKMSLPGS